MKGQNIKKYQQKELNLMFKTDEKTRNYMIALPCNQLPNRRKSNRNPVCKNTVHF